MPKEQFISRFDAAMYYGLRAVAIAAGVAAVAYTGVFYTLGGDDQDPKRLPAHHTPHVLSAPPRAFGESGWAMDPGLTPSTPPTITIPGRVLNDTIGPITP